jgi:hypothetical protein
METLGLSDSTPRSESRLKALFWPAVQTATDVDYLGTQGYWVCTIVALVSLGFFILSGHPVFGAAVFLLYYGGGIGVRERSLYAAGIVFVLYLAGTIFGAFSVLRIIFTALLLSNLRATWIASKWKPDSEEAVLPPRLNETFFDKVADQLPQWLWPKIRVLYYIFVVVLIGLFFLGFAMWR